MSVPIKLLKFLIATVLALSNVLMPMYFSNNNNSVTALVKMESKHS